jgi:uncharacterized protein (TIGR01777 family)
MANGPLRHVVVAGGSGLVGRHLVAVLGGMGIRATVLSRSPGTVSLPPGAEARGWDALPGVLDGADAVINLCGAGIADRRWTAARKQALLHSRVAPTEGLVRAMGAAGPRVLVNASAVGIYGAMDDRPVDEGQAPGDGFLPQVCGRWEAAAEAACASGVRVVRLRLGVVLARDGGALPRMALPVRLFLGTRMGRGRQGLSWIHVDDLVRLILEVAANPAFQGPVNATAPRPVSNEAFTRALAQRLHRPLLPVPAWATRAAVSLLLGEMGAALLLEGAFVHPREAERLGFAFRFQRVEDALADLL